MKTLYCFLLLLLVSGRQQLFAQTDTVCSAPYLRCKPPIILNSPPVYHLYFKPEDLLDSVADNCSPSLPLEYSIVLSTDDRGVYPLDCEGISYPVFDTWCNSSYNSYSVWAKNAAGLTGKCTFNCSINDFGGGTCEGDKLFFHGCISTQTGAPCDSVPVQVQYTHPAQQLWQLTLQSEATGHYGYHLNTSNFILQPSYNRAHRNGVSSFDLLLLSRHILGVDTLDSPYLLIAADANKSGSITTFDIVELRKLVLGVYDSLPNNASWRFVDLYYQFTNPTNPFLENFPEFYANSPQPFFITRNDFIAIKIGDLNLNAVPPGQLQAAEDRNAPILPVAVADRQVAAGEVFEVNIATPAAAEALQFSLEHYGLELLDNTPEAPYTNEHFAHFPEKATLTAAFDLGEPAVFTLRFRAQHEGFLSEMLRFSDAITHSEAVVQQQVRKPVLQFESVGDFSIAPNPNAGRSVISFRLENPEQVRLRVYDALGRCIWAHSENYPVGVHQVSLDLGGQRGVFYVVKNDVVQQVVVVP